MAKKIIKPSLKKECSLCGKAIKVLVYSDKTYRGGHYFFNIPAKKKKVEYWECPKCYWKG